jgi:hypothetical protein
MTMDQIDHDRAPAVGWEAKVITAEVDQSADETAGPDRGSVTA